MGGNGTGGNCLRRIWMGGNGTGGNCLGSLGGEFKTGGWKHRRGPRDTHRFRRSRPSFVSPSFVKEVRRCCGGGPVAPVRPQLAGDRTQTALGTGSGIQGLPKLDGHAPAFPKLPHVCLSCGC
jgi:hypothetical protein